MNNKILSFFALSAMLIIFTSCGPNKKQTPVQPTTALVKVSLLGTVASGTTIGGVDLSMTLPAGVSVKTQENSVETSAGVVTASGVAVSNSQTISTYNSSTGILRIVLVNASGFGVGEVALVNCEIAAGHQPVSADFSQGDLTVADLNGNPITDLAAGLAVEIK